MMRRYILLVVAALLIQSAGGLLTAAIAQISLGIGPKPTTFREQASAGGGGGACNAGQLDFSDACNTTQYMVLFR